MIGQPVVEAMLSKRLGSDRVSYSEQVDSLTEDDDGVNVVTSSGRRLRSKYALGADGARSTVRKAIGATFTGTKPEMLWAVLDTFIDTDFPLCDEIITFQLDGQSRVSWIPRERGLCRFYVLLEGEVNQARAEESIQKHMAPYRTEFVKTEWYSTFDGRCSNGVIPRRHFFCFNFPHLHKHIPSPSTMLLFISLYLAQLPNCPIESISANTRLARLFLQSRSGSHPLSSPGTGQVELSLAAMPPTSTPSMVARASTRAWPMPSASPGD